MTPEELAIIDSKLSLAYRTQDDWTVVKAFLTDRDVIVMESEALPSAGHMTIADGALLAFQPWTSVLTGLTDLPRQCASPSDPCLSHRRSMCPMNSTSRCTWISGMTALHLLSESAACSADSGYAGGCIEVGKARPQRPLPV